jgi:hypothetical protein
MTTYLLDSNIFIQAKNLHYGLDFCPAFWQSRLASTPVAGQPCSAVPRTTRANSPMSATRLRPSS